MNNIKVYFRDPILGIHASPSFQTRLAAVQFTGQKLRGKNVKVRFIKNNGVRLAEEARDDFLIDSEIARLSPQLEKRLAINPDSIKRRLQAIFSTQTL